jgi:hypothetical protein
MSAIAAPLLRLHGEEDTAYPTSLKADRHGGNGKHNAKKDEDTSRKEHINEN